METPIYYMWRVWYRSIEYLRDIFRGRRAKWFVQRRKRGFDDRDLWSLDMTIAEFVYPRLKAFNEVNKCGLASCFFGDPENSDPDDEDWKIARKNQKDSYDKMEQAFFYIISDGLDIDSGIDIEKYPDITEAIENSEVEKWRLYRQELDRREEVIKDGLAEFSKNFRSLWD